MFPFSLVWTGAHTLPTTYYPSLAIYEHHPHPPPRTVLHLLRFRCVPFTFPWFADVTYITIPRIRRPPPLHCAVYASPADTGHLLAGHNVRWPHSTTAPTTPPPTPPAALRPTAGPRLLPAIATYHAFELPYRLAFVTPCHHYLCFELLAHYTRLFSW